MSLTPKYSVVVPVYNRPQELEELLQSLIRQTVKSFEVIIVEDGSSLTSESLFEKYSGQLNLHYFFKPNTGPGPSRNFGFEKARGDYFVVFDSDCILPPTYFESVDNFLSSTPLDAWGGPDRGHENFTTLQQAMAYTMSSFFTTGGIRGGSKHVGWFQPRSFNMGISRNVFEKTGGFKFDRYAEDIEFSIRMKNAGFHVGLIPEAYVFHKRRTTLQQFYRQVSNFGKGRAIIGKIYPSEVKVTHWFPTVFTIGYLLLPFSFLISVQLGWLHFSVYLLYLLLIGIGAVSTTKSPAVGLLSIPSVLVQMTGYGLGFLKERFKS